MSDTKKILLSGVQPSGRPHIGNYFAVMKQNIAMQETHDAHLMIADLHALTTVHDGEELKSEIFDLAIDYLALGFNPEKALLFQQSSVPEHTEATWIFNCITSVAYLIRSHAYKDAYQKQKEINAGLFDYPMLMAADILLYDAEVVPVGSDQAQHIEFARDTAEKFNRVYGETFVLPEAYIMEDIGTILGVDGRKMSKSYKNSIPLFAEDEEIERLVMSITTDSKGVDDAKDPDSDTLFALHKLVTPNEELENLRKRYIGGGIGYKESKEMLSENLKAFIQPLREVRRTVASDKTHVLNVLKVGGEKAREKASKKMGIVRKKVGVTL